MFKDAYEVVANGRKGGIRRGGAVDEVGSW